MVCSQAPNNAVFALDSVGRIIKHCHMDMLILSNSDEEYYTAGQCVHSCVAIYVWQAGGMELLATWNHVMEMSTFVGVILVVRIALISTTNLFDLTNNCKVSCIYIGFSES